MKSIAQNPNLDPVFARHEPILEEKLGSVNAALAGVSTRLRTDFRSKLALKQKQEGKKAITDADRRRWDLPPIATPWQHWEVPFDTDPDYPADLKKAVEEYRAAHRAKMDEVNACIAANADREELVDQPEIDRKITRVSGPFTVEAVQPPEMSLGDATIVETGFAGEPDELGETFAVREVQIGDTPQNLEAYLSKMVDLLRMDGVRFPNNKEEKFTRLDAIYASGSSAGVHAEGRWVNAGETDPDPDGAATVGVVFGPQYGPITAKMIEEVTRPAARRYDDLVFAGFSFDGPAQAVIDEGVPRLRLHIAHIRPDVNPGMNGLLKEQPGSQLFTVFGRPRTAVKGPDAEGMYTVEMEGVDVYDPVNNTVVDTGAAKVAAWFVDGDYDGRTFCITQAFFPDRNAWEKLSKALAGVVDPERFESFSGTVSLPFPAGAHKCIAVKVIDPRGNEVMRVTRWRAIVAKKTAVTPGREQLPVQPLPVQPVDRPILCNPYEEPRDHWIYDKQTGAASRAGTRRPASYWYKTERTGSAQLTLTGLAEEERDDLPLVNALREDVRKWREAGYAGATNVTRDLLRHWARADRARRLFFCQLEAVETIIYLQEIRFPGKVGIRGNPKLAKDDLIRLLAAQRPSFSNAAQEFFPRLVDPSQDASLAPLRRIACKMATGSGKTVVMSMVVAWAFCNRGQNPATASFPNAVLICCPNLTVKERLQVLRPARPDNYYEEFDIVPLKYRPLLQSGKVLVTNWHRFAPESEHVEGGKSYAVVNKGPETPDSFARRVLEDLYDRLPIMVMNDEGHHCWRPAASEEDLPTGDTAVDAAVDIRVDKEEAEEARVWLDGLDRINNCTASPGTKPGVSICLDLSATPFYLKGSGYPEGRPFPWIVSDFGLVDAIESGIVKIPRLPVLDTTGRPDPKYFKLWRAINDSLEPGERLPGKAKRPKPEVVYREAEGALQQIASQWKERFQQMQGATPGQEHAPPVLILVCDNTDIAEVFYRKISGETEVEIVTESEVAEVLSAGQLELAEDDDQAAAADGAAAPGALKPKPAKSAKRKTATVYGKGAIFPEYFSNTSDVNRTIRIDTKLLAEAESDDPKKKKPEAAEELRRVVATVGKPGQPGEHVRCVVSVSMLTEGWDANNVTHILGIRAFGSQLLCEQVVGRGLRRMDYVPDPKTGLLTEEYVDVYGIPFTVIPFKGRPLKAPAPDDRPKNHVRALPERKAMEMRFPVVEGYAFALRKNLIRCDVDGMPPLEIEPNREPTATFVRPTVGYAEGSPAAQSSPFPFNEQNREEYYRETHLQTIEFQIARLIVDQLTAAGAGPNDRRRRVLALQSRHQLFPQVFRYVDEYVLRKVNFQNCHPCELGLEKYVQRMVERLRDAIVPDESEGEAPLMPITNRYKPIGTTAEVDFKTTRACHATVKSHIDQVVLDNLTWESSAGFRLESSGAIQFYARNDHMGLTIPYEYTGVDHSYEPDFLVRLTTGVTVVLEIKGFEPDKTQAKHTAAHRWVEAVNNWGQLGVWAFHVCRNPQLLDKEMEFLARPTPDRHHSSKYS